MQFEPIGPSATDVKSNEEETSKKFREDLNNSPIMEDSKELVYENNIHSVKNGITDHQGVKECEKEKYPKCNE